MESANVDDGTQQQFMEVARARLAPWADRTTFLRMYTSEAALRVPDASLDYVYVGE